MLSIKPIRCFRLLFFLMGLVVTQAVGAQIENISSDKEVAIDRLYAGLLTTTGLLSKNSDHSNFASLQFGARISLWVVPERLRIRSFGVVKLTERQETKYLKSYEVILTPEENLAIHFGTMATPTTELRPNPVTWQSQVETNAESLIPGGKPGFKIRYGFNKNVNLAYGIHNHDYGAVQHLKMGYKQFSISGFLEDDRLFMAAKWRYENGSLTVIRFKNETAVSTIIPFSRHFRFYFDMAYKEVAHELTFGEWGLRRHFQNTNLIRGFLSISYSTQSKNLQGGLFIHI